MENESIDLRNLILMIKEQKQINANLALEFDCFIEANDVKPLVKVINYAINYITQLTDQPLQISLNASMSGITIGFTAFIVLLVHLSQLKALLHFPGTYSTLRRI